MSKSVCFVCEKEKELYQCPTCNAKYCGLDCYKRHNDGICVERFKGRQADDHLKGVYASVEEKKKMNDILNRIYNDHPVHENIDNIANDDDSDDNCNDNDDDNEDEEEEEEEKDFDDDELEKKFHELSFDKQQEFIHKFQNGDVSDLIQLWTPWWEILVSTNNENEDEYDYNDNDNSSLPKLFDEKESQKLLPKIENFSKTSPLMKYSIIHTIACYSVIMRLYNGDWKDEGEEVQLCLLSLLLMSNSVSSSSQSQQSPSQSQPPVFHNENEVFDAVIAGCEKEDAESVIPFVIKDTKKIRKRQDYILRSLCDSHRILSFEANQSKNNTNNNNAKQQEKERKLQAKRILFFIAYISSTSTSTSSNNL